jgi:hypothetical protein
MHTRPCPRIQISRLFVRTELNPAGVHQHQPKESLASRTGTCQHHVVCVRDSASVDFGGCGYHLSRKVMYMPYDWNTGARGGSIAKVKATLPHTVLAALRSTD